MHEFTQKPERLPSESPFGAARGNLFAGMHVLMQGGTDDELAHAADTILEYRCTLTDRFAGYSDERLATPTEQNIAEWVAFMQHDEQQRSQKWEELSGMPIFEMTDPADWQRQAVSFALRGEQFDFDLADKLGIDPISYLSDEDESGEWVIDLYDERLVQAIDNLMMFAPPESQAAFMSALERFVRQGALKLTGDLEIDTVIKALEKYKPYSEVLSRLMEEKEFFSQFSDHDDGEPIEFEFHGELPKQEVIEALQQSLEQDDMNDLERIWIEGLLATQQQA